MYIKVLRSMILIFIQNIYMYIQKLVYKFINHNNYKKCIIIIIIVILLIFKV